MFRYASQCRVLFCALILASLFLVPSGAAAQSEVNSGNTFRVATNGSDNSGCGPANAPCRSIQYAINKATSGDWILVAAGSYTYNQSIDPCNQYIGAAHKAVVCVLNKQLAVLGGFTTGNWQTANPGNNVTVIDGGGGVRGVEFQQTGAGQPAASIWMEGFTIQNGLAQGASSGNADQIGAFGGGFNATFGTVTLKHMIFRNNRAVGGNATGQTSGGAAAGGAVSLRSVGSATLDTIRFEGNSARGGDGATVGGYGHAGGLFTYMSSMYGKGLTFANNTATGGSTQGSGVGGTHIMGDGVGGGIGIQIGCNVTLDGIYATGNIAQGGNAPNGDAGGGYGGGMHVEGATLTATNLYFKDNAARGGTGRNPNTEASLGQGGGIGTMNSILNLGRSQIIHNSAVGGAGQLYGGPAGGGGVVLTGFDQARRSRIENVVIADNTVASGSGQWVGGGGGGLWVQGVTVDVVHTTIAGNQLSRREMQGQGIVVMGYSPIPSVANISYSIVANHTSTSAAGLYVQNALSGQPTPGATLNRILFANNTTNTNQGQPYSGNFSGTNSILAAGSAGFVAPGSSAYDYHLSPNSPAIDQGGGSNVTVDIDGQPRTATTPDLGADELMRGYPRRGFLPAVIKR